MRKVIVITVAVSLVVLMAAGVSAQEANEWSQFQKDAGNTGSVDIAIPEDNTVSNKTGAIDARAGSQPVISGNRAYVYTGVGDTSGAIVCFDLVTYQRLWEAEIDPPSGADPFGSWSSPTVSGGVLYIGSGSKVYALNATDGSALWVKDLGELQAGASIVNGSSTVSGHSLFIGDWQNGIYYCLDVTDGGSVLWSFNLDANCNAPATPAVDGNMVFVGQSTAFSSPANGKVWCLDISNGKPVTSWGTNGCFETVDNLDVTGSVTVEGDYIYFTDYDFYSTDSHLYCVGKEDGKEAWKGPVYPTSGTPAVGEGIVVSVGDDFHTTFIPRVSAFAAGAGDGGAAVPLWTTDGIGGSYMSASVAGGKVAVGGIGFWSALGIAVLDASDGTVLWRSDAADSTPVPTAYGLLSISAAGELVTFGGGKRADGDFYFAEGTTRDGYYEWICLENPGAAQVDASIRYMMTDGSIKDQPVTLPPDSRTTVDVNLFLGPGVDASAHVTGNGYFVAERSMYVDTGNISGGEQVMGVSSPSTEILFAEGTTRSGYRTWLALQNPGNDDANVLVTYIYPDKPPSPQNLTLKGSSRQTVDVNLNAGEEEDVSIAVNSTEPIIGERVMYFEDAGDILGAGPNGVHNSTGVSSAEDSWYFAEGTTQSGFQEWLCLMNPAGRTVNATVRYLGDSGVIKTDTRALGPNSRTTLDVSTEVGSDRDVSMHVTADGPIVAERPMYFQYVPPGPGQQFWGGGHDTTGARYAAYRWEFAEGTTRDGYQTFLCIANPNNLDVEVAIDYVTTTDDGTKENITENVQVAKNTRYTVRINNVVEAGRDVSTVLSCALPVVVERPMYFGTGTYFGGGTSLGFPGPL